LSQDLDEDSAGGGGVLLIQLDVLQTGPRKGVSGQQMCEELGHVAQLVGLQSVDGAVLGEERLVEGVLVLAVDHAEPLPQKTIVLQVGPLVGATLDKHIT
jgi:hypothetical protein